LSRAPVHQFGIAHDSDDRKESSRRRRGGEPVTRSAASAFKGKIQGYARATGALPRAGRLNFTLERAAFRANREAVGTKGVPTIDPPPPARVEQRASLSH